MRDGTTSRYRFSPSGTIWPSGDFSLGYRKIDLHGAHKADRRSEVRRIDDGVYVGQWSSETIKFRDEYGHEGGVLEALEANAFYESGWLEDETSGPLDLTNARNPHSAAKRPEKYGKLGITGYGRKMVKSAATLIQKMPGKRTTFATVTMPTLPRHLRRELALAWPEFVRQLVQWLSRQLKKQGLPPLICSVTEIQPGRLSEYREAYLHLHLVWPNHWAKEGNWAIDVDCLRSWCSEFLQRRGLWVADAWVNVDVKRVKKTAAGYLSKYMSKGSDELLAFAEDCGWDALPGQWWNLSKPARDLVKKWTRKGEAVGRLLECVLDYVWNTGDMSGFHWLQECMMELVDRAVSVGWYGVVTAAHRKDLLKILDNAVAN